MSDTDDCQADTGIIAAGDDPTPSRRLEGLPPAARRALREADERRAQSKAGEPAQPREIGGRGGEDPARFGDWEVKGIAVDF